MDLEANYNTDSPLDPRCSWQHIPSTALMVSDPKLYMPRWVTHTKALPLQH